MPGFIIGAAIGLLIGSALMSCMAAKQRDDHTEEIKELIIEHFQMTQRRLYENGDEAGAEGIRLAVASIRGRTEDEDI